MIIPKMAFRNIFRQRRRSLLTGLMMMGGFTLCSVFLGIQYGSYGNIIDLFTRDHTGHVQIHRFGYLDKPSLYRTMAAEDSVEEKVLGVAHVESVAPRVYSPALAFVGKKTTGAEVVGIDPIKEASTTRISHKVDQGQYLSESSSNDIIIGGGLAEILNIGLDDEVALIGQGADGSIANDIFKVRGIISKEVSSYDKMKCYMHIKKAQEFLVLEGRIHEIAVLLDDEDSARKTAIEISEKIGDEGLSVDPWQVVEKEFYRAMLIDNQGNYISQGIIILMVAIGVLDTVLMSILERTKEFGVMRALGTRPAAVFKLIVIETLLLCLIAIAVGVVLSFFLNYYLSIHGIKMSTSFEYGGITFDTMLSEVSFIVFWVPALVTFLAAVTVSVFPAIRAARIVPVKALRAK